MVFDDMVDSIICDDCIDVMRHIPDRSIDLIVTSPPYNIGKSMYHGKYYDEYADKKKEVEYVNWLNHVLSECLRLSRYVMWNIQFVRTTREHIIDIHRKYSDNIKEYFIWHKNIVPNIKGKSGNMAKGFEFVFMLGHDSKPRFEYNNFPSNGYVPNIMKWLPSSTSDDHHATFPLDLPLYFIQYFSKENDIVLDPFVGSGTTCVAAAKLNRRYIGIDTSENYCNQTEEAIQKIIYNPVDNFFK